MYNSSDTSNDMFNLKAKLAAEISEDSVGEANMITGAIVKKAACRMEPKKSDISKSFQVMPFFILQIFSLNTWPLSTDLGLYMGQ